MKISYKIQSIVFPTEEKHRGCRKLFYRGSRGILDVNKKNLSLGYGQNCDFVTYLNACSYQKWKTYTNASNLTLHLIVEGDVEIIFLGYNKDALTVNRKEYETKKYTSKTKHEIVFSFPENNEMMVGFEISALSKCTIFGGYYTVDIDDSFINDVKLSIATTTCKKEEFIKKNTEIIKKEILNSNEEIADNAFLHVIDNGQTLTKKDINGKHVFLHPNINAGGSGGFARGMIESLIQKPAATHILLMDDDVLVLSESIKRTFSLLKLLKKEYRNHFISGAMLYYEDPIKQHEDIGTITTTRYASIYKSLKDVLNHEKLEDNLENEINLPRCKNSYAAWWYCCVPAKIIEKNGLPLPLFIRCDDSEYSLRCNANFITMNGICIWHMGFGTKYNAAFDLYQQFRNWLIAQSTSNIFPEINLYNLIYDTFRLEMMRFNYGSAELIIKALEDYNKGPKFIEIANGEKITKTNFKLNDTLLPLENLDNSGEFTIKDVYENPPTTIKDRIIAKITWNGQRLCPKCFEHPGIVPISFDGLFQLHKIILHTKLLAINPYTLTGTYRIKDKKKFKILKKRFEKASRYYNKHKKELAQCYSSSQEKLTSKEFWEKYLNLR